MTGFSLATLTAMTLLSHTPYHDAYESALENERPLVVLIGAPWCPHCHTMQAEVEAQLAVDGTAQRISFAYVDLDRQPTLARRLLSGDTIPQLIVYQKADTSWQRRSLTGSQSAATVRKFIGQSLSE